MASPLMLLCAWLRHGLGNGILHPVSLGFTPPHASPPGLGLNPWKTV
ncbi:hypothetical protein K9N68_00390 [Kovacikia minuta CCNUW1]|nr:hypothetical protein [Kovacikia minuta]UBF26507.1 hypothetical protein K9N68_00390 [Kovacikia minuta CCNUW1]